MSYAQMLADYLVDTLGGKHFYDIEVNDSSLEVKGKYLGYGSDFYFGRSCVTRFMKEHLTKTGMEVLFLEGYKFKDFLPGKKQITKKILEESGLPIAVTKGSHAADRDEFWFVTQAFLDLFKDATIHEDAQEFCDLTGKAIPIAGDTILLNNGGEVHLLNVVRETDLTPYWSRNREFFEKSKGAKYFFKTSEDYTLLDLTEFGELEVFQYLMGRKITFENERALARLKRLARV